jgi:hypothetical protein
MIFLVWTPAGLKALENSGPALSAFWLSAGVATPVELADLRARGAEVTQFTQRIHCTNPGGRRAGIGHNWTASPQSAGVG